MSRTTLERWDIQGGFQLYIIAYNSVVLIFMSTDLHPITNTMTLNTSPSSCSRKVLSHLWLSLLNSFWLLYCRLDSLHRTHPSCLRHICCLFCIHRRPLWYILHMTDELFHTISFLRWGPDAILVSFKRCPHYFSCEPSFSLILFWTTPLLPHPIPLTFIFLTYV